MGKAATCALLNAPTGALPSALIRSEFNPLKAPEDSAGLCDELITANCPVPKEFKKPAVSLEI
jgi:hypothetical protein